MTTRNSKGTQAAATVAPMPKWMHNILLTMHLLVLVGAAVLVVIISSDAIRNISFISDPFYLEVQYWICLLFLLDILLEVATSQHRLHALLVNLPFIIICVPYLNILYDAQIHVSGEVAFVLRCIPMIRAAGVVAMITGTLSRNRVQSLMRAYIILLITLLYFASLMFFVEEHGVNPQVATYGDSLWWAMMCTTTAGCNINEVTAVGKALSIILSGGGLILFPVFTVYFTNTFVKHHGATKPANS